MKKHTADRHCTNLDQDEPPDCGHSVCSQNFIDTGDLDCIDDVDPTPYETSSGADPADTIRDSQVEAMRYKR